MVTRFGLSILIFVMGLYYSLRFAVIARSWWGNAITLTIFGIGAIGSGVLAIKLYGRTKTQVMTLVLLMVPIVIFLFVGLIAPAGLLP